MNANEAAASADEALKALQLALIGPTADQMPNPDPTVFSLRNVVNGRIAHYNHLRAQQPNWSDSQWASVHDGFATYFAQVRMHWAPPSLRQPSAQTSTPVPAAIHSTSDVESKSRASRKHTGLPATDPTYQRAHAVSHGWSMSEHARRAARSGLEYLRDNSSLPLDDIAARLAQIEKVWNKNAEQVRQTVWHAKNGEGEPEELDAQLAEFEGYLEQDRLLRDDIRRIVIRVKRCVDAIDELLRWRRVELDTLAQLAQVTTDQLDVRNDVAEIASRLQRLEAFACREPRLAWPDPAATCQALAEIQRRIKLLNRLFTSRRPRPNAVQKYRARNFESIDAALGCLPT